MLICGPLCSRRLGSGARSCGGVLAVAQPCPTRARPESPQAGRTVAGTFPPRPALSSASLSPAGALRPSRRPARGPSPAALSADPRRSAALGFGPGPGRCCHPNGAQLEPGSSLGSCFLLSPLKGRSEKGKGACAKVAGVVLRLLEERPAAAVDRLAPFTPLYPRRSAEL